MQQRYFKFNGPIIEVLTLPQWEVALVKLLSSTPRFIGIDCEWKPESSKSVESPLELIQLSSDKVCVLLYVRSLRLQHGVPDSLANLLTDPNILKITHSFNHSDRKKLSHLSLEVEPIADVAEIARSVGFKRTGLKHLAHFLLGYKVNKRWAMSDWSRFPLLNDQVRYAATDAFLHQRLYVELLDMIHKGLTVDSFDTQAPTTKLCQPSFSYQIERQQDGNDEIRIVQFMVRCGNGFSTKVTLFDIDAKSKDKWMKIYQPLGAPFTIPLCDNNGTAAIIIDPEYIEFTVSKHGSDGSIDLRVPTKLGLPVLRACHTELVGLSQ